MISIINLILENESIVPSDVISLSKATNQSTNLLSRSKQINNTSEFIGAFEVWFKTLGMDPKKISRSFIKTAVDKVLVNMGYR